MLRTYPSRVQHQHLKGLKREETDRISVLYPFLPLELYPFLPYRNLDSGKICSTFASEITTNLNGDTLNSGAREISSANKNYIRIIHTDFTDLTDYSRRRQNPCNPCNP